MKKRYIIIPSFLIILFIGIIMLFTNNTKETYAASNTLADTVIALSKGSSWSSGASGVYYTNSHEYRYVGANVNNFVSFNNDLYRIIGVFDANSHGQTGKNLVKLISANVLMRTSQGAYNSSATSGTYSSYKNDWTGSTTGVPANLNLLLNEYFYKKTNTSSTYGACGNWTYYYTSTRYRTNDCTNIIVYGINSTYQNYIEDAIWYLYGYSSYTEGKKNMYKCERGQYSDSECTSGNSGAYDTSTTAKIGLMYVSDYMYACGYYSSTDTTQSAYSYHSIQNWLYQGSEWFITPGSSDDTSVFCVTDNGGMVNTASYLGYGVRPTFYLKSTVYVTGGDGSFDNPYTIACDNCG